MRVLIRNGYIVDGSGTKGFFGSIVINGEHIELIDPKVTEAIAKVEFDRVIDAEGLVVAPGFIDTHSHSDLKVLIDPYLEPKVRQGITTEIIGQDGISMAPLPKQYIQSWRKNLAGLNGDSDEIDWGYETTEGYLNLLEKSGIGVNESYLIPHGNIRMEAMGLVNRQPTKVELQKMREIIRREMQAGAIGLSTGLIYIPCSFAGTEEIIELCKVIAEFNGVFVIHQRSEADDILYSMQEVIRIACEAGVKVHISHFKVCGKNNWSKIDQVLALLDKAQTEEIRVSFDQYPYLAGSTMLGVILPPWAHDGGTDQLLKRLADPGLRKKIINDIKNGIPGWDNFVEFAGLDKIFVVGVKTKENQDLVGKNLIEIGEIRGKDPYEAALDLLLEEKNAVSMVDFYGLEEHVVKFMQRSEQNVCTDGLLWGKPHPRVFGTFPRVLSKYVREEKVLALETAIHKMTAKPAQVFGLVKRGLLKKGNFADIVIFNPDSISENGNYIQPAQYPTGIEYVIINGQIVIEGGQHTKLLAGKVLRYSKRVGI